MPKQVCTYAIVGGGLAGASAVQGIREHDKKGTILLFGNERHLPYDRPPLSKKLWSGQKRVEDIFVHDRTFYEQNGVSLVLGVTIIRLDAGRRIITDDKGEEYQYEKLLLTNGGVPRTLSIPGGNLEGVCYYRYLDDYLRMRKEAAEGKSAVIIGGGFIGSEVAASLAINKIDVTMIFPDRYLCSRVFPDYLGTAIQDRYRKRGITVLSEEKPASIIKDKDRFITETSDGRYIESDMVIVGIGIVPDIKLATDAGLQVGNGIAVDEHLRSSDPDIYAAGDNALFPYRVLGKQMRVEHWDNALNQGKYAGWNMAGAHEPYTYMPYFFSDLFEFGYEAVGEVDATLDTFADWQKENDTGVIYYLRDGKVRGAMMCNVWEKVDAAREIIRKGKHVGREALEAAIR